MKSYFERFFEEKNLDKQDYKVMVNGTEHKISSDYIISIVKQTKGNEAKQIENVLTKIDFHNGDVHHFLKHLAEGYLKQKLAV